MPKLPRITPKQLIRALKRAGFVLDRIHGSHHLLYKDHARILVSVPMHSRDLKPGTLHAILRTANMSIEELLKLL